MHIMKKKTATVVVIILVVAAIVSIWLFKNAGSDSKSNSSKHAENQIDGIISPAYEDAFTLEATAIGLDELKVYGIPIIIDFGADSCIPCKEMAPVLRNLNSEMQGKAIIKFVDVWKNRQAADGFPIQLIPQVLVNSEGNPYVPSKDIGIEFTKYVMKDTGEHIFTVHQGGLTEDQMRKILADMGIENE